MNKIAIVAFHSLHLMQFLYKYTNILDEKGIEYDVIYWDRDLDNNITSKKFKGNAICFKYKMDNYQPKQKKIIGFIKCISFVKKTIKQNNYDKLVVLTTQSALPLYSVLLKYKNRYIFDYRDITFERVPLCKRLIQNIIKNSEFTSISSEGFISVLGKSNKFVISHNCSLLTSNSLNQTESENIRVVYWGMIRQVEFNKKVCDLFGNDTRFEVYFHGEGYFRDLQQYCKDKGYQNIEFTGRYSVDKIPSFAENTDILLNVYANDGKQKLAMTVKLYDGIRYKLPMLVTKGSYMADYLKSNHFALPISVESVTADVICDWYKNLHKNSINAEFNNAYNSIAVEDAKFEKNLLSFVR